MFAQTTAALAEVVVSLGGTILDVRHVGPGRSPAWSSWTPLFSIGEGPGAHLPVAFAGQGDGGIFNLVESAAAGIRVRLASGLSGTIVRGGASATIAAVMERGETAVVLQAGDAAEVQVGPALVKIRVEACTPVERFRAAIDRPLWASQGAALTLMAALMIVIQRTPPATEAAQFDDPDVQANLIRYLTVGPKDEVSAPAPVRVDRVAQVADAEPARAEDQVEEDVEEEAVAEIGPQSPSEPGSVEAARTAGVFGVADFMAALERAADDARASGARYVSMARDDSAFIAGMKKAAPTVLTGLGLANTGRQGGGSAAGVIDFDWSWLVPADGLRSLNPKKLKARAEKERFAAREPPATLPERRQSVVWTASVGRDLIRGVVNRNKPDVRRCFRDGAIVNPALAGEVEVAFTIQSDGAVAYASVARSTLADAAVEACVTETVKRWRFPTFVASGGDVDVRFPFAVGKA